MSPFTSDTLAHQRLSGIARGGRLAEHVNRRVHAHDVGHGQGRSQCDRDAARPAGQLQHAAPPNAREQAGVVIAGALVFHVIDVGPGVDVGPCGPASAQLVEAVTWLG